MITSSSTPMFGMSTVQNFAIDHSVQIMTYSLQRLPQSLRLKIYLCSPMSGTLIYWLNFPFQLSQPSTIRVILLCWNSRFLRFRELESRFLRSYLSLLKPTSPESPESPEIWPFKKASFKDNWVLNSEKGIKTRQNCSDVDLRRSYKSNAFHFHLTHLSSQFSKRH